MMYVDKSRCDGCQACLTVCPVGAIFMQNGQAVINESLCTECRLCQDACPQKAILLAEVVAMTEAETATLPARRQDMSMITKSSLRSLVGPALGSALLWTGREIVPRLAALALRALEIQIQNRTATPPSSLSRQANGRGSRRGGQKRLRQRRRQHHQPSSQYPI
ncbi:MAG: 4Fe-4S dicluster domain-containing protein [Chloroflexi bacterium]|nr:4Fe-4S dicluster domain-containing protein [Chloroflexota bacterium]